MSLFGLFLPLSRLKKRERERARANQWAQETFCPSQVHKFTRRFFYLPRRCGASLPLTQRGSLLSRSGANFLPVFRVLLANSLLLFWPPPPASQSQRQCHVFQGFATIAPTARCQFFYQLLITTQENPPDLCAFTQPQGIMSPDWWVRRVSSGLRSAGRTGGLAQASLTRGSPIWG